MNEPAQHAASANDAIVIGSGLAGKAACIHLAKAGLRVICIESAAATRPAVGESLDWSAPELLRVVGLPMEHLVETQVATWKRYVTLRMRDGCSAHYVPTPSLAGLPFHIELRTLHVDRTRLDAELAKLVAEHGVTVVHEKISSVERQGERIVSMCTGDGSKLSAPWFIDASGFGTSLLGRELDLPVIYQGPAKVAAWKYFTVPESIEGTTLYMDPKPSEYLDWLWEIPVQTHMVSVGYITTGAAMKKKREKGLSVEEIFREQLAKFPRFEPLLQSSAPDDLNVTSFRCRVHSRTSGPNWLITGEAASMVDPITSNGVTAALRQAAEASALILKYQKRGKLPLLARALYSCRIVQLAKFFNGGIEKIVYEPAVRNRIGLQTSGTAYTSPAWTMNVVYARLKPKGIFKTFLLAAILSAFRCAAWVCYRFCSQFPRDANAAT